MFIAVKINLEMAHVVPNSANIQERNIHGHTWKFEVTFEGDNLDYDKLYEFVVIKIVPYFDHALLINFNKYDKKLKKHICANFDKIIDCDDEPTCENVLKMFQGALYNQQLAKVAKLKLWEGAKYYAKIK